MTALVEPAPIVVGVDGSVSCQRALQWSLRAAEERGCTLRVVNAWHLGPMADFRWQPPRRLRAESRALLTHAIEYAQQVTGARPPVLRLSLQGPAARVLIEASRSASLLVVGARRAHSATRRELGSVSRACLAGAPVPVMIVDSVDEYAAAAVSAA